MSRRFPLEAPFLRAEHDPRLPIGLVALGVLLKLAFSRASDERFAAELAHRLLKRGER